MKKIINYLNETIKKEKPLLIFAVLTFILGLIAGSLFINLITEDDKSILIEQVTNFFLNIKKLDASVFGLKSFTSNLVNNQLQLLILFILGISMIGILAVIFILFFKGFMLGTTLATIIVKYGIKGILGSFLYVFPVMIINILIYLLLSFFALYVSVKFLKALFKKDNLNFKSFLGKYLLVFIISIILMTLACLLDSFLSPLLLKLFTYLI